MSSWVWAVWRRIQQQVPSVGPDIRTASDHQSVGLAVFGPALVGIAIVEPQHDSLPRDAAAALQLKREFQRLKAAEGGCPATPFSGIICGHIPAPHPAPSAAEPGFGGGPGGRVANRITRSPDGPTCRPVPHRR